MKFNVGQVYFNSGTSLAYECVYDDVDIVVFKFQYQGVQRGSVVQKHELKKDQFVPAGHRVLTHKDF